jgi:endonuclease YncB( thermonuclease family)
MVMPVKRAQRSIEQQLTLFTTFMALLAVVASAGADSLDCPCKVVKVSDGDTVHVLDRSRDRHKIRLGGIDAPEKDQAFGRQSTHNLARYISGKSVLVEYSKRDQYDRIIGKLLLDGRDINLTQVKEGYAWHYKRYQNEQSELDRVLYSSAETEARAKKLGLWSVPAVPPWEYRRARRK